jgi:type IV secretory pathway VirJ component
VRDLFAAAETSDADVSVSVSYMEIYNDQLYDLLEPYKRGRNKDPSKRKDMVQARARLRIREDARGGTHIHELSAVRVGTASDVFRLLHRGNEHRSTRHTEMNQNSSRGHAILQLRVQQRHASRPGSVLQTKINLVDLAGSERNSVAAPSGASATETHAINVSLSALVGVVAALTQRAPHVPYRDSKLTLLLKDSLGGNCSTFLLATISPVESSFNESVSTLKFADRASNIVNSMVRNSKPDLVGLLERKDQEISRLRAMLIAFNEAQARGEAGMGGDREGSTRRRERRATAEQQSQALQAQIDKLQVRAVHRCSRTAVPSFVSFPLL